VRVVIDRHRPRECPGPQNCACRRAPMTETGPRSRL
jgi:hypothetical protein